MCLFSNHPEEQIKVTTKLPHQIHDLNRQIILSAEVVRCLSILKAKSIASWADIHTCLE